MMFFSKPRVSYRFEVASYIRACQNLLIASYLLRSRTLTKEEAELVEYHNRELAKYIGIAVEEKKADSGQVELRYPTERWNRCSGRGSQLTHLSAFHCESVHALSTKI